METSIIQTYPHIPVQKRQALSLALEFLEGRIKTINNVTQWAAGMGYSRSYFSRRIHKIYGETAISLLHKIKLAGICEAWNRQPSAKAFSIAKETGFKDDKSILQFLSRNFHVVTADVRKKAEGGFDELDMIKMSKEEIYCYFKNRTGTDCK